MTKSNLTIRIKSESKSVQLHNLSYAGPIVMGCGGIFFNMHVLLFNFINSNEIWNVMYGILFKTKYLLLVFRVEHHFEHILKFQSVRFIKGFIIVAACVMTFEARESAAKVVPARFKLSIGNRNNAPSTSTHNSTRRLGQ